MSPFKKGLRVFFRHKPAMLGLSVICFFIVIAIMADFIAPVDPILQDLDLKFVPPIWQEGGRSPFIFGTDVLGRDLFSRLLYGSRISLLIGTIAVALGAGIGVPIGMLAGYVGGMVDIALMRVIDVMLAFPSVLLAVCIVAILGPSLNNAMIAIGIIAIPHYTRVVRSSVLAEKEKEYVLAERALGQRHIFILIKAVFPNVLSPLMVIATLNFASAVLEAAALSFIGLGAQPPEPEWGALLLEGKSYFYQAPWLILYPGLAILFTVLGFNLLGDGLRDAFDPRASH